MKNLFEKSIRGKNNVDHNLMIESHYEFVVDQLGGEALIKKRYPYIYTVLQNSRKPIMTAASNFVAAEDGNVEHGIRNSMKIRTLNYDPSATLATDSSIDLVDKNPSIVIVGSLNDRISGQSMKGFAVCDNNSHHLAGGTSVLSAGLISADKREFLASSTFYWTEHDLSGNEIMKSKTEIVNSVKVQNTSTLVKDMTIIDPMPVRHVGGKKTTIYYNRKGVLTDTDWDYYYDGVKSANNKIDIHLPFRGTATFDEAFLPSYVDKNQNFLLQIENIKNGVAEFNTLHWDEIKWTIDGSTISWEFPNQWYSELAKHNLSAANNLNLYCKMVVVTKNGISVPLVIQSNGEEHEDPSYKKIPSIELIWGCLGKDSLITLEDGNQKPITEMKVGDRIMARGGIATVRNLIAGMEERLIMIRSSKGNSLMVTDDHPLATTCGNIMAGELTPADVLVMGYGCDSIEELHYIQYNDNVYSLELDAEDYILANGFFVGDFHAQNTALKAEENVRKDATKLSPFQEEVVELVSLVNEERGGEHG